MDQDAAIDRKLTGDDDRLVADFERDRDRASEYRSLGMGSSAPPKLGDVIDNPRTVEGDGWDTTSQHAIPAD